MHQIKSHDRHEIDCLKPVSLKHLHNVLQIREFARRSNSPRVRRDFRNPFVHLGSQELSPIIKDIKIVGQSYGAEPRSIIKGYIRRIIDCTVSSKKQQKVIQLVGEAVDMLNARGFKFDRAKKQADAVRVMRELGH